MKEPDMNKSNIGSTLDSWLREEGLYEELSATALKRVTDRQAKTALKQRDTPKSK